MEPLNEREDGWNAEELELSRREAQEAAGLLAFSAPERRPPPELKARVLTGARAASLSRAPRAFLPRWAAASLGAACAAALLVWSLRPAPRAVLADVRGAVRVDGRAANAGETVAPGATVTVAEDGQAVLVFGARAAVRLLHGAGVSYRESRGLEVELKAGWILSAVKTGTAYRVATAQGRVAALGTDFLVKAQKHDTYLCMCHGRLELSGDFGRAEVASQNHGGWVFTADRAPSQPDYGTMEGHADHDISSLRAFLE